MKNIFFIFYHSGLLSDAKDRVIRTITGSATAKVEMADSCIIVTIHSDSKTNIDKCKKKLDETLEHNYVKLKIESYKEIVKSLSSDEVREYLYSLIDSHPWPNL